MKKLFTFGSLLLYCQLASPQNVLSCEFGSSAQEVKTRLKEGLMAVVTEENPERISASSDNLHITYFFDEDRLFKMEVYRSFPDQKGAFEAATGLKSYFEKKHSEIILLDDRKLFTFAALDGRVLHEVSQIQLDRHRHQVRQVSLSLDLSPPSEMEALEQGEGKLLAVVYSKR